MTMKEAPAPLPRERLHLSKIYLQRDLPQRDPGEDVYESLPSLSDVSVDEAKQPDYTKNIPGIPPESLPVVLTIPLKERLPILRGPKGKNTLYTTYVGETYYRRPEDIVDFDLNDLAGNYYKLKNEYNLLTDRHLKPYLRQHHVRDNLNDRGLLTDDGKVVVNVRDYNEYRRYLRYYNVALAKKADEMARAYEAERHPELKESKKMALASADINRKHNEQAKIVRARIEEQRLERLSRIVQKTKVDERRLIRVQERDMDEALEKEATNRIIEEKRRQIIRRNQLEERKRQMQTIKSWVEDDQLRVERRKAKQKEMADLKAKELRDSWEAHKTFQQDLYEMESQRRRELEEERRKHIHYRDIAFHRRRELAQEAFYKIAEKKRKQRKQEDEHYLRGYNTRIQTMRTAAGRKGSSVKPTPRSYGSRQILMCATTLVPLPPVTFTPVDESEEDYEVEEPGDDTLIDDNGSVAAEEPREAVATDDDGPVAAVDSGTRVVAAAVVAVATASAAAILRVVASDTNTGDFLADDTISCDAPRLPGSPESTKN